MKTRTKHTPGPWSALNSHKAGFRDVVAFGNDEPQSRKFICEIPPSDTMIEDSQLIAAAPALLDSLKELTDWAAQMGGWESPAWERARAAVAQAQGRKQ